MSGWIKLHRKMLAWEWYDDHKTKALFLHLLLTATHKPSRWRGVVLQPGQLLTGRKKLADSLGFSQRSIITSLNRLKTTSEVIIKPYSKFSVITIVNWDSYQVRDDKGDQQNDQQNDQQPINNRSASDHIQECKELKKVKKKELLESDSCSLPATLPASAKAVAIRKPKTTLFNKHESISKDQYRAILADYSLAAGDRDFLLSCVDKMADWSASGGKRKTDWAATLRNWVRTTREAGLMLPNGIKKTNQPKSFSQIEQEWSDDQTRQFLEQAQKNKEIDHA